MVKYSEQCNQTLTQVLDLVILCFSKEIFVVHCTVLSYPLGILFSRRY